MSKKNSVDKNNHPADVRTTICECACGTDGLLSMADQMIKQQLLDAGEKSRA